VPVAVPTAVPTAVPEVVPMPMAVPMATISMAVPPLLPHTWLTEQPDGCWYQFREGPLKLVLQTTDPTTVANGWAGVSLRLLYADTKKPVIPRIPDGRTFKQISCSVTGNTMSYILRIDEITRNHRSKAFCYELQLGNLTITTNSFQVLTKRTKRKTPPSIQTDATVDPVYKRQTQEVLRRLQWSIGGYASGCTGFVDFTRPFYTCSMCNGHQTQGHVDGCPIIALLL
jgi:hypothetical protein